MSLPKEPRQLMINLMYLFLTAMLALNVSAEVMGAFRDLDASIEETNRLTRQSTRNTEMGMREMLNKKPKIEDIVNQTLSLIETQTNEILDFIGTLRKDLIDESGNKDGVVDEKDYNQKGHLRGEKNKDVTTRLLIKNKKGTVLESLITETRDSLLNALSNLLNEGTLAEEVKLKEQDIKSIILNAKTNLSLQIGKEWKKSDKKTWAEYKFKQMPVGAVLPILQKIESDAISAEAALVEQINALIGGQEIKAKAFFPIINAKKSYLIKGEPFEAEVAIGTYSDQFGENATITINGQRINLDASGKGTYKTIANNYGKQSLDIKASVFNPFTEEMMSGSSVYEYEVGERSVAISLDKMNVLYIGVDNPITISAAGTSSNDLKVNGNGVNLRANGNSQYSATVTKPGRVSITISGDDFASKTFNYIAKRIPTPTVQLGDITGAAIGNGTIRAYDGLRVNMEQFNFDAKCEILGFELAYEPKRKSVETCLNKSGRFGAKAKQLIQKAKPGDTYYFDNIKVKCPGDIMSRKVNPLVFKIK